MNSGQTRKAAKETPTQCHADPSLYLFPVKTTISKSSEHTRCPGSAQQQGQKEGKGHTVIYQMDEKKPKPVWNMECSRRARAKAALLPTGIQYPVHRQNKFKWRQNGEFVNKGNESSKVTRKATNRKGYYKKKGNEVSSTLPLKLPWLTVSHQTQTSSLACLRNFLCFCTCKLNNKSLLVQQSLAPTAIAILMSFLHQSLKPMVRWQGNEKSECLRDNGGKSLH